MSSQQTHIAASRHRKSALLASLGTDHYAVFAESLADYHISRAPEGLIFLKGAVQAATPDILILDCEELSAAVIAAVSGVRPVLAAPFLIFAARGTPEQGQQALRAGADSCVIDGLVSHRLPMLAAIAAEHYKINSEIRGELDKTRLSLESRKLIDRAKGILMDQRGLKEAEAYELMRQNAMSHNQTMRQVAENILSLSGLFG